MLIEAVVYTAHPYTHTLNESIKFAYDSSKRH